MDTFEVKKTDLLKRLKRAEGQVRGVHKLVENEADCEKVVQQLAAVRKALDKAFYKAVACAMEQSIQPNPRQTQDIEHYTKLLAKYG